jgi:PDZ domain-containing protein
MNFMVSKSIRNWLALGFVGAAAPLAMVWGQAAAPPAQDKAPDEAVPKATVVTELLQHAIPLKVELKGAPETVLALIDDEKQEHVKASEYWIGIALGELPAVAKKQLKLEHGLVVEDVMPDSPAAKAEFKQHDVVVLVGDKPVDEPMDVVTAVEQAKDKEIRVVLFRDGKEMAVKVTPVKRPKPTTAAEAAAEAVKPEEIQKLAIKKLEDALLELKGKTGQDLGLYLARPGVVDAGAGASTHHAVELPKNMTISITREGDAPAKIHVKRDDKEWNTTSDKLSELPEDVRSQVEQMLSRVVHPMLSAKVRSLVVPRMAPEPRTVAPLVSPPTVIKPKTTVTVPTPPTPPTPSTTARFRAYQVERGEGTEAKLDLILKKLETIENKSIEQLQDEVKRLRKELDELRSKR